MGPADIMYDTCYPSPPRDFIELGSVYQSDVHVVILPPVVIN